MSNLTPPLTLNTSSPAFPSLYISPALDHGGVYLYNTTDVWKFTALWTIIIYEGFHLAASGYAAIVQPRNWKVSWLVIIFYAVFGGIEAFFAGSIVGLILGTAYQVGQVKVSTWVPLVWSVINVLVLVLSSFSIHGGL